MMIGLGANQGIVNSNYVAKDPEIISGVLVKGMRVTVRSQLG